MLSILYAERRYAECRYAECHYAECRHTECHGALVTIQQNILIPKAHSSILVRILITITDADIPVF